MQVSWFSAAALTLFAVLAFFSFSKLTESPPTWFDEGIYLQVAMNHSTHGAQEIQLAPGVFASTAFVTGGYPFLKPISWSFSLFGTGLLQARIVMVGFIFACVAVFFFLVRALFGNTIALASLLLLVTFPPLYGQGKNVLGEVPGLFFLGSFLLTLFYIEKNNYRGTGWYLLAGITAGLCVASKPVFLLLGGALALGILFHRRSITFRWGSIALGTAAFLVPVIVWLMSQFSGSDSVQQVVGYYANPYDIGNLNAEMFKNALRFFQEASPLYFLVVIAAWAASFVVRLRARERINIAETVAFIFALLVWAAYLRTAGWYRYFFVAEVLAVVFLPYALHVVAQHVWKPALAKKCAVSLVVLFAAIQTYQLLFTSWVATHAARTTTRDMEAYMATLPPQSSFFLYNAPAAAIFLPNQNYYQYLVLTPKRSLGVEMLSSLSAGIPDFVITGEGQWEEASSTTMSRYSILKIIDGFLIAKRRE